MNERVALIILGAITALAVSITSCFAGKDDASDRMDKGGAIVPCSLAGVNPAYHPEIFGNPAVARSYGFVRSPDGTWQVVANCRH